MGLRKRAYSGVLWSGIGQFGSYALRYLIFLVLAWVLIPDAIGLESLTTVLIVLAQEIGSLGLGAAIIQREEHTALDLDTAFWASLIVSLMVTGIVNVLAGDIAGLLGDVRTAPLIQVLSIIFPIRALLIVPQSLLMKQLAFKKLSTVQFVEQIVYGLVALPLAFMGAGVWSLVVGRIVMVGIRTVLMWIYVSWTPSFSFDLSNFWNLIKFGYYSLASNILTRGLVRVDYFLVGKLLGTESLGYYTLASQLAIIPGQRIVGAVERVAFPTLSLLQDELTRLKQGFFEALEHLFAILVPLNVFLVILSPLLIPLLYGSKWMPAVPLLQILAFTNVLSGFDINKSVFYASGKPRLWMNVIASRILLFILISLGLGLQYQVTGVAVSFVVSLFVTTTASIVLVMRALQVGPMQVFRLLWVPLRGIMLAMIPYVVYLLLPLSDISGEIKLAALMGSMGAIYGISIYSHYRETIEFFASTTVAFLWRQVRSEKE